ncbi:unnamed protein product [Blepharisma stoltei]|uniref:Uncharacterized protein n=1 Tax=Blepharisma stoltei TaxID=1481888 RepID=A0AAU9JR18_9CILI|nr:unnamed protein product [Blepharisma stoltei]
MENQKDSEKHSKFRKNHLLSSSESRNISDISSDSVMNRLSHILGDNSEIYVESAGFIKDEVSESQITEVEDVADLPENDRPSVPRLQLDRSKSIKSKSTESYPSLGTVIRHDTPKITTNQKILNSPYKKKSIKRPQSAKLQRSRSVNSKQANDEAIHLTQLISNDLVKSIHHAYASKYPGALSNLDQKEIQQFFQFKTNEFQEILERELGQKQVAPYQRSKRERLRINNKDKEKKREEIRQKNFEDEMSRVKKSTELYHETCEFRLKKSVESTLQKYKRQKIIEDSKIIKEQKEVKDVEKKLIIENIKNLYNDKIQLLKEKIDEEKFQRQIDEQEQKKRMSEAEKSRKTQRLLHLKEQKEILSKENEHSELILLEAKHFEEKIIERYKKEKLP